MQTKVSSHYHVEVMEERHEAYSLAAFLTHLGWECGVDSDSSVSIVVSCSSGQEASSTEGQIYRDVQRWKSLIEKVSA